MTLLITTLIIATSFYIWFLRELDRLNKNLKEINDEINKMLEWNKTFNLIDYKGKCDYIQDKELQDSGNIIVGEITKQEAIQQAKEWLINSKYYGIPAYVGDDKELLEVYNKSKD